MYISIGVTKSGRLLSLLIFFCLALLVHSVHAQETKYTSFLWEITGNGLSKPSYLLGSVHLKDRRLINSNDSIFVAIANTDALALEIHPDTLYKEIWDIRFNKRPSSQKIELSDEQKNEFIQRYEKKYGVIPDSQQIASPYMVEYLLNPSHDKPDDITAVFDAYLYGLARSQRKQIIGLEPMDNQTGLRGSSGLIQLTNKKDSSNYYQHFEQLMRLYSAGNLDGLWKILSPNMDIEEMQSRNNTMLNNIIAQLDKGTVCAVVGAAHLPGNIGLIHLLELKGYRLRPVKTRKTNLATKYKIDYSTMEWAALTDSVYGYAVSLPKGYAHKVRILGGTNMMYGDLSTQTELMVSAVFVGGLNGLTTNAFLKQEYEKRTTKVKHRIVSEKLLEKDGVQGMQIVTDHDNMLTKSELWLKNNTLYTLSAFTNNGQLDDHLSDRFFNSFTILDIAQDTDRRESIYETGAFAIKMPPQTQHIYQSGTELLGDEKLQYGIYNYFSMDRTRKINYMVQYHDYPIGYTMTDRTSVLKELHKNIAKNPAITITSVEPREKDNAIGTAVSAQLEKSNLFAQTWIRGNRIYQVLQENLDKDDKEMDSAFFSSFRMIPFKKTAWKDFTLDHVQLKLPASSLIKVNDVDVTDQLDSEVQIYAAADSNSSTAFMLEVSKLPKYVRFERRDSLFAEIVASAKKQAEELVRYDTLLSGGITAAIYTHRDSLTANYHKKIIWTRGNVSYGLDAVGTQEAVEQVDVDRIMKSVRYKDSITNFDLYSSKAAILFADIYSPDTLVARKAKNILGLNYKFAKDDLLLIYEMLGQKQTDDHENNGLRRTLIYSLVENHDERSVPALKSLLKDAATTDLIKNAILPTIWEIDSTQLGWYLQALNKHRPQAGNEVWRLLHPLTESRNYVANNLDNVIPLLSVDNYRSILLDICLKIASDSTIQQASKLVHRYLSNIMQYLDEDLSQLASEQKPGYSFNHYSIANYVELMGLYKQKYLLEKFQQQLLADAPIGYLRATTACEFLVLGLPLRQSMIDSIYANLSQRYVLMNGLKAKKHEHLVPARYREQNEIGKIVVSEYLQSEWEVAPLRIDYLGQLTENDKLYLVYTFKTEGDKQSYLSIYIPDPENSEWTYNFENCYSDLEPSTDNWKTQALQLIRKMNTEE